MRVLIPGIAGAIGRKVALHLRARDHEVIGIDVRPWRDAPDGIEMHHVDIRKRAAEDVFRTRKPDAVVHLATVTALRHQGEERSKINLGGTRAVFDHARAYGVKHAIFVGRHTFYGAAPDSPLFHHEDEPPMALATFPELADLVAADLYASTALWRFPDLKTAVLRVVYSLGPTGHGTLASFLRGKYVPTVIGFDPLFQFLHEEDVARAICAALERSLTGVFNVAGLEPVPLSIIIRETGRTNVPLPEFALRVASGRAGLPKLPRGALEHIKYPVVVDGTPFRRTTDFAPTYDEAATFKSFRDAFPVTARRDGW